MYFKLNFLILLISTQKAIGEPPITTEYFANSIVLIKPDIYTLYWNFNKTDVVFDIQVKTTGWALFGLSPNGGMDGSDVIVTWVDKSGKVNFTDRHIVDRQVVVDKVSNWNPIKVTNENGYLVAKFSRKIKICDPTNEDRDIEQGSPYVIFSYGKDFELNGDIKYQDMMIGNKTLPLISTSNPKAHSDTEDLEITDFRIDSIMDNKYSTILHCQIFQLPTKWFDLKRHVIRYETLFTPETKDNYHHWRMLLCSKEFETIFLKRNPFPKPGYCVRDNDRDPYWINIFNFCRKNVLTWATGSSVIQDFPEELALSLGGPESEYKYFLFESHFNNPEKIPNLRDQSGLRLYTTTNYRKYEGDTFVMGTGTDWKSLIIPPKTDRFETYFGCSSECVDGFFEENDEIKVFAYYPHLHQTGIEGYITVIRNNKEIEYIGENRYYDFNYQYIYFLAEPFILKKGDRLKITCVYNSQKRENFTFGGHGSQEEMCSGSFMYYPKTNMIGCYEKFKPDTFLPFFDTLAKDGDTKPINATDDTTLSITILNSKANLGKKFQDFFAQADRLQGCSKLNKYFQKNVKAPMAELIEQKKCVPSY